MVTQQLLRKVDILRQHERYGYQIAYYLLGCEDLAILAATQAFLEIMEDHDFFQQNQPSQKHRLKQVIITHSMRIKASVSPQEQRVFNGLGGKKNGNERN